MRFKLSLPKAGGRQPESMVLKAYRGWRRGLAVRDLDVLEGIWKLFTDTLSPNSATLAFDAMAQFVRALDGCASCPLRRHPMGDDHLHPDEALVIGLISALQNDDTKAASFCLSALTCHSRCEEVEAAASLLAMALKVDGQTLLPASVELQPVAQHLINHTLH